MIARREAAALYPDDGLARSKLRDLLVAKIHVFHPAQAGMW